MKGHLPARYKHLLPKNYEALRRGFEAAHLLGSLESESKSIWSPSALEDYEKCIVETRAALSEEAYNVAYAEGRAMKMDEAVEYALKELRR